MSKDFFYYVGSQSEPPCLEGINRFVMTDPILVKQAQWESIRTGVSDGSNVRKVKPVGLRSVYFNAMKDQDCAHLLNHPFDVSKHTAGSDLNEAIEREGGHVVRITNQVSSLSHSTDSDITTGQLTDNIKVEKVNLGGPSAPTGAAS